METWKINLRRENIFTTMLALGIYILAHQYIYTNIYIWEGACIYIYIYICIYIFIYSKNKMLIKYIDKQYPIIKYAFTFQMLMWIHIFEWER